MDTMLYMLTYCFILTRQASLIVLNLSHALTCNYVPLN